MKEVVMSMEVSRERGCVNDRSLPTLAGAVVRAARRVDCSESTGVWLWSGCVLCECAPCAGVLALAVPGPTLRMHCVLCNSVV